MNKVYCTTYALSAGVILAESRDRDEKYENVEGIFCRRGRDSHDTEGEAAERVRQMVAAKRKSIAKQLAALDKIGERQAAHAAQGSRAVTAPALTLRRYTVPYEKGRSISGWGLFVIADDGYFSAVTDYGNYAYKWSDFGGNFRRFLVRLDEGYVCSKVNHRQEYDGDATLRGVRQHIIEYRRDSARNRNAFSREAARKEWDLLAEFNDLHDREDFHSWCNETSFDDAWEFGRTSPPADVLAFCERLFPRFQQMLRDELAGEAAVAPAAPADAVGAGDAYAAEATRPAPAGLTDADRARLDEIAARAEAAAPGPWTCDDDEPTIRAPNEGAVAFVAEHANVRTSMARGEDWSHADARFIASARADVPWLLEQVRALAAEVAALRPKGEPPKPAVKCHRCNDTGVVDDGDIAKGCVHCIGVRTRP